MTVSDDVLKLVFESRSAELRAETEIAFRLMGGFVTLQLALATWLASNPPTTRSGQWGVFLLNLLLGVFAGLFIWRNYGRRQEIISTLSNVADVWKLRTPGALLSDRALLAEPYGHSWRTLYLILIFFFCAIQAIPIFSLF